MLGIKVLEKMYQIRKLRSDNKELTKRELEIAIKIAEGKSTKVIAFELQIKTKTVEVHKCNLYKKIEVNSNVELTRWVIKKGLIEL